MNQRSRTGDELQQILEAAEERLRISGASATFADLVLDETCRVWGIASAVFWDLAADNSPRLRGVAGVIPHAVRVLSPDLTRDIQAVRPGFTRVLQFDSATSPSPDSDATSSGQIIVAASDVAGGMRLVAGFDCSNGALDEALVCDVTEVLADLRRRSLTQELLSGHLLDQQMNHLIALLHADLDEQRVVNTLASDAAELLHCRRVSVARCTTRPIWSLVAATAVATPDPRSDASRRLCRLIRETEVAATSRDQKPAEPRITAPPRSPAANPQHPSSPSLTAALPSDSCDNDSEFADSRAIIRPLSRSNTWNDAEWAVVFEPISVAADQPDPQRLARICMHASLALANCRDRDHATISGQLRRLPRRLLQPRTLLLPGLLLAGCAVLTFWKTDLRIAAAGTLVPSQRFHVFAPESGVIHTIRVEDGSVVSEGDILFEMTNEDLQLQLEVIHGDLSSAQARLAAIESIRGDRSGGQSLSLSAEQAELNERIGSLQKQQEILSERISRLTVRAAAAGRIYGDRLREQLGGRPVQRGQYLFQLADPDSSWELELRIPETDVRYVLEQMQQSEAHPLMTFTLETSPEKQLRTELVRLSEATEVDDRGQLSTRATAPFPPSAASDSESEQRRPGSGVIAQIHCGRRAAGFVFFRKVIEFVQRLVWH